MKRGDKVKIIHGKYAGEAAKIVSFFDGMNQEYITVALINWGNALLTIHKDSIEVMV